MALYFTWDLTLLQMAVFALLLLLFCVEVFYLYFIYNRVAGYVGKTNKGKVVYASELPSVSVVVYAHGDEAEGLLQLLPRLLSQKYPSYEVIIVTDDVSDEVHSAVDMYELEYKNVYKTHVPDTVYNVSRKKLGITLGVKAAKNDIILLTDAYCNPLSDNWIHAMARNFVPGVDIVLGYTRFSDLGKIKKSGFRVYDRLTFGLRYLTFALMKQPYMGVGSNLAYRKEVFFANKGFSTTLHLHFGDDDLLVNEMARKNNTRVEVSPESIVESSYPDNNEAWDELRMRYGFTSRYLRTSSKRVFGIEGVVHVLWAITWVASVYVGGFNILCLVLSLLLLLMYWLLTWHVYLRAERILGERCAVGLVPIYHLLRPYFSLYYSINGNRYNKHHYTWQYMR
jgi:cellulose synthase/poly-beta-1,6-N-acetylglucosamine synthase-like glycosyltransferase